MNDKPATYIFHGHCNLPTPAGPYSAMMVSPNRDHNVRRGKGHVGRLELLECGLDLDDGLLEDGFARVDIIGASQIGSLSDYVQKLASMRMEKTEIMNICYGDVTELFDAQLDKTLKGDARPFCPLYGLSTDWEPGSSYKADMRFYLCLAAHAKDIDEVVEQIRQADTRAVKAHV